MINLVYLLKSSSRYSIKKNPFMLNKEEEEEQEAIEEDETINIMGKSPWCAKRKTLEERTQHFFPLKRLAVEFGLTCRFEVHYIMERERQRQRQRQFKVFKLIASKDFGCRVVMEALSTHLTNKYSDGMPGYIDYEKLEEEAMHYRPRILVCRGSSYPGEWDYGRLRRIADKRGTVLMCDMAHISGLGAAKEVGSPFDYCDIVTSTTHKSLRGPRGGIIFYRRATKPRKQGMVLSHGDDSSSDFEEKINFSLNPSFHGGPHNNLIAALAIAFKQVKTPGYKVYMQQVKKNAKALASALMKRKCRLVTDGTDNHLCLWDLTALELIGIPAMTSRGCSEEDFETIADFPFRAAQITSIIQREHGKSYKDFLKGLQNNKDVIEPKNRVKTFASHFAMPGFTI